MHYSRWRISGDPLVAQRYGSPEEALNARSRPEGDCIVYTGSRSKKGYGQISVHYENIHAHRVAWELANGKIPAGMHIDHICHNKACIKVEHLRLTTPQQNKSNHNGANRNNKSTGVRNVGKQGNRFRVSIRKEGKLHYFGSYKTLEEAEAVADEKRQELFGEYAGKGGRSGNLTADRQSPRSSSPPFTVD